MIKKKIKENVKENLIFQSAIMSSYEFDTTMECRDNGVLCGVMRRG